MVGNFVLLRRQLTLTEVVIGCIVVCGFVSVALTDFHGRNDFEPSGIAAVFGSLALEAIALNLEEKLLSDWKVPQIEAIPLIFSGSAIISLSIGVYSGQCMIVFNRILRHPFAIVWILVYAVAGSIGLRFTFFSIATFGSLQTVMFTSLQNSIRGLIARFVVWNVEFSVGTAISWMVLLAGVAADGWTQMGDKKDEAEEDPGGLIGADEEAELAASSECDE
jgi:hypothetical protein